MKSKLLIVFICVLTCFLSGCISKEVNDKPITNVPLIEGYKKQKFINLEYQVPKDYNSINISDTVSKSEKEVGVSNVDGLSRLRAIVVVGISDINSYKNDSQFLYDLSQNIDGNKNEMFTYYDKKINGSKWRTGDSYILFKEGEQEIYRYQVNVAVHKDASKYYGVLFAFPNNNAGKTHELEYPEFEKDIKNIFSSLVIES